MEKTKNTIAQALAILPGSYYDADDDSIVYCDAGTREHYRCELDEVPNLLEMVDSDPVNGYSLWCAEVAHDPIDTEGGAS